MLRHDREYMTTSFAKGIMFRASTVLGPLRQHVFACKIRFGDVWPLVSSHRSPGFRLKVALRNGLLFEIPRFHECYES